MNTKQNDSTSHVLDGGPAFPRPLSQQRDPSDGEYSYAIDEQDGMSLRDWFAGQVLAALVTTGGTVDGSSDLSSSEDASLVQDARVSGWGATVNRATMDGQPFTYADLFADEAYTLADAMVRRRVRA